MSLIERLEAASGPDRELDALAMAAVTPGSRVVYGKGRRFYLKPGPERVPFHVSGGKGAQWDWTHQWKQPTRSIDAAMTLVPEGFEWSVNWCGNSAAVVTELPDGPSFAGHAPTPALALCIASLKARGVS